MTSILNNGNYFKNYKVVKQNDIHYKTEFELHNLPLHFANSFRRALSSRIPIVTFDDKFHENPSLRSINIRKNTGVIHNEFLSHRLSLIPINMNNSNLKIKTNFDLVTGRRDYTISENSPVFNLKKKNEEYNSNLEIYSNDIFPTDNNDSGEYFQQDVFTGDYILINKLHYRESESEELDIELKPTVGFGMIHSRYDPTGTVTFSFKVDESQFKNILSKKISYFEKEKQIKNNNTKLKLNEDEIKTIEENFRLLDKERVYLKNKNGAPSIFVMSVESIGFLYPDQIIHRSLFILELLLDDLLNSVNFEKDEIFINNKMDIDLVNNSKNCGIVITIYDEDHTLGNLLGCELRKLFYHDDNILSNTSYRMNHPTINEIELIIFPKKEFLENSNAKLKKFLNKNNVNFKNDEKDKRLLFLFGAILFIKTIKSCKKLIENLIDDFKNLSKCEYLKKFEDLLENY